jgi:cytochrome P450
MNLEALFEPASRANPHPYYRALRQDHPLWRLDFFPATGGTAWLVTRYADCQAALKHPAIGKNIYERLGLSASAPYRDALNPTAALDYHMLNLDPPDQTRLRGLVSQAFTPARIAALRPHIQARAEALLAKLPRHGVFDLIADFAFPLPLGVIGDLCGLPAESRPQFGAWVKSLLFSRHVEEVKAAAVDLTHFLKEEFARRRAAPQDDLLSDLVTAQQDGQGLSATELLGMVFLLLAAGYETTVHLIGNGMLTLLEHPAQLALLREQPALLSQAIEEMLRYNGPIEIATLRWALEDTMLNGQPLQAGDGVLVALLSANRDESLVPEPDRFDLTRPPSKHLAFGHGLHYCLGAPLARLEAEIAFHALLTQYPRLRLAQETARLSWHESLLLHGLRALPVRTD